MLGRKSIRWGICGTSAIAYKFAEALCLLPRAKIQAVASRTFDRAKRFGQQFSVPACHGSYEELANDKSIDIVYVGTSNPSHEKITVMSLRAGKAVLCEKPLAVNARQAERMVATARKEGQLLMEAMWTRFVPAFRQVQDWLSDGMIGDVQIVQADFGFRAEGEDLQRWLSPDAAAGGLMHVGVYCVSFAMLAFAASPNRIKVMADISPQGTDKLAAMLLGFPGGGLAVLASAVDTKTPRYGNILGTQGMIRLHQPFYCSPGATLAIPGREELTFSQPIEGNGLHYQAEEMMDSLERGELQNKIMPQDESIATLKVMDQLRRELGVYFDCEAY